MVNSCARIISELKTLIKLQNGGNFIIDILHIYKILFFNVNGEDQQKKKNKKQKNKTAQQQKTMVIRNVASTKSRAMLDSWLLMNRWCILRDFLSDDHSSAFWLYQLVSTMTNSQNTHMVMTEKSSQSPTSIRLTTILWWRQIAGGWRTLNSVYTLRKNSCLNQEAN